jgi:Asp-tRNA(Asn)/Glu-tRNA(Gln) amidotransferase C subunit
MNAYELAKAQQAYSPPTLEEIVKQQADRIAKYEEVLNAIANDYHELSDHKIEVQNRNYKKWARAVLSEKVSDCNKK